MLEQVLQGGGGSGNTKDSTGIRAPDPLDSDIANALLVEGQGGSGVCFLVLLTCCPRGQQRFSIPPT